MTCLPGLNQYLARINVLAGEHNAGTPVRLERADPPSRVNHFTTKPPVPPMVQWIIAHANMDVTYPTGGLQWYNAHACSGVTYSTGGLQLYNIHACRDVTYPTGGL